MTTISYTYGSGGGLLREREVAGGTKTRFHWEGLNLYMEEEWSGSAWVPKRAYINQPSALGGALARFDLGTSNTLDSSDNGWFYHYDEAGNVILITDKNGGLIKHFEQDAWGNDLNGTFATTQNIRQHQTAKYLDEVTGLYFFGARWYDPAVGRFISVSPLSPLGEEEYVYCGDDPVNSFDVNGLSIFSTVDDYWKRYEDIDPALIIRPQTPSLTGHDIKRKMTSTYGGQVCAAFADGVMPYGDLFGEAFYNINDRLVFWSYLTGVITPYGGGAGSFILRPFTSKYQLVTHWSPPGAPMLKGTQWVMTGGNTFRNYLWSGVIEQGYPRSTGVSFYVKGSKLNYPPGIESWKGLIGQRIYNP